MDPLSKAQVSPQNTPDSRLARLKGRGVATQWKKGKSANPGGRPKKLYITKIYELVLRNPKNRKEILEIIMSILKSKRMMSVLLLREMAERTEGKVTEDVSLNVTGRLSLAALIEERRKKLHGQN